MCVCVGCCCCYVVVVVVLGRGVGFSCFVYLPNHFWQYPLLALSVLFPLSMYMLCACVCMCMCAHMRACMHKH